MNKPLSVSQVQKEDFDKMLKMGKRNEWLSKISASNTGLDINPLNDYPSLKEFSFSDIAIAFYFGYEVTPESQYNHFYDKFSNSEIIMEKDFLAGMKYVAKLFNLNVKGKDE